MAIHMGSDIKVIDKLSGLTVEELAQVCAEEGVTIRSVCKTLAEGMRSNIMRIYNDGVEDSGKPDNPTRHKYMTSGMDLLRMVEKKAETVKEATVTHRMAPEDIERLEKIAMELKGLERRLVEEKIQQGEVIDV